LTSTYFESDPPEEQDGKRRFGYSRDEGVRKFVCGVITLR
jgi:hypothetical protein